MGFTRKHVDLEVPGWGEVALGPHVTVFTLRPFGLRPEGARPVPWRPTALLAEVLSSQSLRTFVFRSHLMRPLFFRPQGGAGRAVMVQSQEGAFPDRPRTLPPDLPPESSGNSSGGSQETVQGITVWMSSGVEQRAIEHDLGHDADVLHSRFVMNPGSVQGGSVVVLRGVNGSGSTTFDLSFDGDTRVIELSLATGQTMSATLVSGLAWHCVEVKLATQAGAAGLWINGLSVGSVTGTFGTLATRRLRLGAVEKSSATVGMLYLDEWVMDQAYIGPVVRAPVGPYADDPARWLVVYNTAVADSVAWAEFYRQRRGVPYANLVGLNLSTAEVIDAATWDAMRGALSGYIAENHLSGQIAGILIGFGVPGVATIGGVDLSVASLAADLGNTIADTVNPLYLSGPIDAGGLPQRTGLLNSGRYLVAECNAESRALTEALSDRADGLQTTDAGGRVLGVLSPQTDRLATAGESWSALSEWLSSVGYQQIRLPAAESFDGSAHGQAIEFTDASAGEFTTSGQARALLASIGSGTADSVRGGMGLANQAINNGYAFVAGHVGSVSTGQSLNPAALTAALRADWCWAEAVAVATPTIHSTWRPVGDPLATLRMPRAGWDVFGPLEQLEDLQPDQPDFALREDELSIALDAAHRPASAEDAYYLIRHVDDLGRAESGTTLIHPTNISDSPAATPLQPVWPDVEGWPVWVQDGQAQPGIVWDRPARQAGVQRVELIRQDRDGSTAVVATITPGRGQRSVHHPQSLTESVVRYGWRVHGFDDGVVVQTPWSAYVGSSPSVSIEAGFSGVANPVGLTVIKE